MTDGRGTSRSGIRRTGAVEADESPASILSYGRIKLVPFAIFPLGWRFPIKRISPLFPRGGIVMESVRPDLIVHPIGVGMFSQAQFDEWVEKARQIA